MTVTVMAGTMRCEPERTPITACNANTNVARKIVRVMRVTCDRTKTRTTRGEYWLLASCTATSVVENTTARNVSMAAATTAETAAVAAASAGMSAFGAGCSAFAWSSSTVMRASTNAITAPTLGRNHSDPKTFSVSHARRIDTVGARRARTAVTPGSRHRPTASSQRSRASTAPVLAPTSRVPVRQTPAVDEDARAAAVIRLRAAGCVDAEGEARAFLAAAPDAATFAAWIARREQGEPPAWITGRTEFCGVALRVTTGVYVPRAHSEDLVRRAAEHLPDHGRAL